MAGNPTASDFVREAPRAKLASISKVDEGWREIRVGEVTDALPQGYRMRLLLLCGARVVDIPLEMLLLWTLMMRLLVILVVG